MFSFVLAVLLWCNLLLCAQTDPQVKDENKIDFKITSKSCNVSTKIELDSETTMRVEVRSYKYINHLWCSLDENGGEMGAFLKKTNFSFTPVQTNDIVTEGVAEVTATKSIEGSWKCTFLILQDVPFDNVTYYEHYDDNGNKHNYTNVTCPTVTVRVRANSTPDDQTPWIIIGGVGGAVIIIFIIQGILIYHFMTKAKAVRRLQRLSVKVSGNGSFDDSTRYSTTPGRSKRAREAKAESGIYECLDNIKATSNTKTPDVAKRPPLPLPEEDGENYYEDGNPPPPPSIESLPRNKAKKIDKEPLVKNSPIVKRMIHDQNTKVPPKPKPKQPVPDPIEEYDYPDAVDFTIKPAPPSLDSLPRKTRQKPESPMSTEKGKVAKFTKKKPEKPLPPPKKHSIPISGSSLPGNEPVLNELDFKLRKRREAASQPTTSAPAASPPVASPPVASPHPVALPLAKKLPSDLKSPPVNIVPPMMKSPPVPKKPIPSSPPVAPSSHFGRKDTKSHNPMPKPPPPLPAVNKPPLPLPVYNDTVSEETYEEMPEREPSDYDSDKDWEFETLKPYNIYNI